MKDGLPAAGRLGLPVTRKPPGLREDGTAPDELPDAPDLEVRIVLIPCPALELRVDAGVVDQGDRVVDGQVPASAMGGFRGSERVAVQVGEDHGEMLPGDGCASLVLRATPPLGPVGGGLWKHEKGGQTPGAGAERAHCWFSLRRRSSRGAACRSLRPRRRARWIRLSA